MLNTIIQTMSKYKITTKLLDYLSFIRRKITVKKINKSLLTNIEWITDYNIPLERFYEKKKEGISWVARLKNADYFLETCLESHIPFLDELILVDNQSTDKTKEICKNLLNKYPDKVKFYEYPHSVNPPSDNNKEIPTNSVHSLAYYYNRSFSKSKYSHVMKVDDDNFLIPEKWEIIRKNALKNNKYYMYRWINIIKDKNWKIWIPKWYEFSWKWGDHWIYPVTPYTYYIQWNKREIFVNNLKHIKYWFSFLHLKFLKPNYWFHNLLWDNYQKQYEKQTKWSIIYDFKQILKWNNSCKIDKYLGTIE